MGLMDVLLDR